jgi:hypothetical protein
MSDKSSIQVFMQWMGFEPGIPALTCSVAVSVLNQALKWTQVV